MIFPVSHADTATTSTMTTNSSNQLWYPVSDGRMRKICSIFLPPSPNHPHYPPLLCDVTPGFSAFFVALALVYFSFFIGRYFMIWLPISFKSAILALFIYLFTHTHIQTPTPYRKLTSFPSFANPSTRDFAIPLIFTSVHTVHTLETQHNQPRFAMTVQMDFLLLFF